MEMKYKFDGKLIGTKTGSSYDKYIEGQTKIVFILDRILLNEMSVDKTLR